MRACPFCAEEIQEAAIKCKHCGEFLQEKSPAESWYTKTTFLVIAFCAVGPLMLPLIWLKPSMSRKSKIAWTVVIVLLTVAATWLMSWAYGRIQSYYKMMEEF